MWTFEIINVSSKAWRDYSQRSTVSVTLAMQLVLDSVEGPLHRGH